MESPIQRQKARSYTWFIPIAIFLIALSVRVIGLKFSFPLLTHHDEKFIIDPLIEMSRNHTLDSGRYAKGNQFLYSVLFGYLNLLSKVFFHKNFGWAYADDPLFFYFHARLVVAFFGSLIPVIAWKIGRLIKGVNFSLAAAFLTCFYPPYIVHSHYITADVLSTVFSLAVIMLCLIYLQKKKALWLVFACITVAINTVEKYPGVLSYGIVLVTLGINAFSQQNRSKQKMWRDFFGGILITLIIVLLSMFLFAPHLFFKLDQVREAVTIEARSNHLGADNLTWLGNMLFYLKELLKSGGWIVAAFSGAGLVFSILSRQPSMLLLFYGAGYWVALSKLGLHWERWSLPMMITPLLLAAMGVTKLWDFVKRQRLAKLFIIAFLGVFASVFALNGLTSSVLLTLKDTRVVALEFMQKNDITQENSVYEGYTPLLPRTVKTIFDFDFTNPGGIDYVILSSNMYKRFEAEPTRYASENGYYTNLRAKTTLIGEFTPSQRPDNSFEQLAVLKDYLINKLNGTESTHTTGPTIQIYKLP